MPGEIASEPAFRGARTGTLWVYDMGQSLPRAGGEGEHLPVDQLGHRDSGVRGMVSPYQEI